MKLTQRILIVKMSAFGDVVQTLPIAEAIKQVYPTAVVGWLISRTNLELIERNPYVDRIFIFERKRWGGGIGNFWRHRREVMKLIKDIRQARFGTILDFQGLFRSAIFTFLSGAPRRIGFARARECAPLAYTDRVKIPEKDIHAIDRYRMLAHRMGIVVKQNHLVLSFERILNKISASNNGSLVLLAPGARWDSKRWPTCHFAKLADLLVEQCNVQVILVGASCDSPLAREIMAMATCVAQLIDLTGQTSILELAKLMKNVDLLVSNDSGPMHLAAALGVPILAIFGPTDSKKTGPYGEQNLVLKSDLPCMPCFKRNCKKNISCMEKIIPCQLLPAAKKILEKNCDFL